MYIYSKLFNIKYINYLRILCKLLLLIKYVSDIIHFVLVYTFSVFTDFKSRLIYKCCATFMEFELNHV